MRNRLFHTLSFLFYSLPEGTGADGIPARYTRQTNHPPFQRVSIDSIPPSHRFFTDSLFP